MLWSWSSIKSNFDFKIKLVSDIGIELQQI